MKIIHFLLTCTGLNDTRLRAGRAASSSVALRPSRKGSPSRGRRGDSSASRAALSQVGLCSSVVFSNKLESCSKQQEHKKPSKSVSGSAHNQQKGRFRTRWLGRLILWRVQFMTMSWMTPKASESLYASRSSGSARQETSPNLQTHATAAVLFAFQKKSLTKSSKSIWLKADCCWCRILWWRLGSVVAYLVKSESVRFL